MDIPIRTPGYYVVTEGFHISTNIYVRDYPDPVTKATTYASLSNLELYELFGVRYEISGFMYIWGLRCQKEVSETWASNCIPQHSMYLHFRDRQNISASSLIVLMKLELWITSHCFGIVHETIMCAVWYILTLDDKFLVLLHDDVIKWKHFPRNWPFVREIHRSPVNFPHKGQWRGALMFSLNYAWINDWVNNREAGDLRRQHGHYVVIVMVCHPTSSNNISMA